MFIASKIYICIIQNNAREIQEALSNEDENENTAKLSKEKLERAEKEQNEMIMREEKKKREEEKIKNEKNRIFIIGVIEAALFGAMIALHVVLSILQSDSSGLNRAANCFTDLLTGEGQDYSPVENVSYKT